MKTKTLSIHRLLVPGLLGLVLAVSSCSNQDEERRRQSLNDMNAYVSEHRNYPDKYTNSKWDDMEREYNEKKMKLDKDVDKMNKEMKESYDKAVADWDAYKAEFTASHEQAMSADRVSTFRTSLLPEGVQYDYSNLNPSNIANVYEHFISVVKANETVYTKEEWEMVNDSWQLLNEKKDGMEDQISKDDNKRIMKVKVEYAAHKSWNKPFAGHEEGVHQ